MPGSPQGSTVLMPAFTADQGMRTQCYVGGGGGLIAQACLTLCDPMDCSPPGSSVHGDCPGKNTGVGCHALLQGIFLTQGLNGKTWPRSLLARFTTVCFLGFNVKSIV